MSSSSTQHRERESESESERESGGSRRRRRRRRRNGGVVWPQPFLESLAIQVAINDSRYHGCLFAAPALANFFQVCSTWRAVSRSEHLWQQLVSEIWGRESRVRDTWLGEYTQCHYTTSNFRRARYEHTSLNVDVDGDDNPSPLSFICRCLALSNTHLAVGFANGAVQVFILRNRRHAHTFRPQRRTFLGPFSHAVTGIILTDQRIIFASLDGDVHVASLRRRGGPELRRAIMGDAYVNGVLLDFAGLGRWWVGLFAGVPGRTFHVWNSETEEAMRVGGWLTDPEAVMGWHQLTEMTELVGRLRVSRRGWGLACTRNRVMVFHISEDGEVVPREEEDVPEGVIVGCIDVVDWGHLVVGRNGEGRTRRVSSEVVCRLEIGATNAMIMGCINRCHALVCGGGAIRVWEVEVDGEYLYSLWEGVVGVPTAMVATDTHVAVFFSNDTSLHLWDFGSHSAPLQSSIAEQ